MLTCRTHKQLGSAPGCHERTILSKTCIVHRRSPDASRRRGGYSLVDSASVNPIQCHARGCPSGITPAPSGAGELETVKISPFRFFEFKSDSWLPVHQCSAGPPVHGVTVLELIYSLLPHTTLRFSQSLTRHRTCKIACETPRNVYETRYPLTPSYKLAL